MRSLLVLSLLARVAAAHQTSVKYVDVRLDEATAQISVKVAPGDVTEPLGLPADAKPSVEAATTPAVAAYVAHWIAVQSYGQACAVGAPLAKPDEEGKWVVVAWTAQCPRVATDLDFRAFFAVDQRHVAIVHVEPSGRDAIARADSPSVSLHGAPSLLAWVREGMNHIYTGRDHISFVLALLLVVMLVRKPDWQIRPPLATLRATATVITAFTIAHSVSLIAASLGWVHLPSRFVESAIAASIAYTAVENIVKPDVPWRFYLTFAFGLVHGLGFASTLAVLLPPSGVIVPLLCFNLGVEIGQLTIVVVALPVFYVAARALGAPAYRRTVMPAISVGIFVLGAVWLIERVFQVTIIGM
ncbi:MAG: HupE/UreJ family protein [Deltaproteobacteria bacterium]|nr:HupE/UreJ family protein [Deltaproteobacteria bacterium]